jgi:hypothetical protein
MLLDITAVEKNTNSLRTIGFRGVVVEVPFDPDFCGGVRWSAVECGGGGVWRRSEAECGGGVRRRNEEE